jgi:hypothetical protein
MGWCLDTVDLSFGAFPAVRSANGWIIGRVLDSVAVRRFPTLLSQCLELICGFAHSCLRGIYGGSAPGQNDKPLLLWVWLTITSLRDGVCGGEAGKAVAEPGAAAPRKSLMTCRMTALAAAGLQGAKAAAWVSEARRIRGEVRDAVASFVWNTRRKASPQTLDHLHELTFLLNFFAVWSLMFAPER